MKLPTREVLDEVVRSTEAHVHQLGWTQDPILFCLYHAGNSLIAKAIQLPLPRRKLGDFLLHLGTDLNRDTPETDQVCHGFVQASFIGVMLAHVVMNNTDLRPADQLDVDLWEVPGSQETRIVYCLDLDGRNFQCLRLRGAEPFPMGPADILVQHGSIPEGLRLLVLAIARRMPDGIDHVEALSRVKILSAEEVHTIAENWVGRPGVHFLKE